MIERYPTLTNHSTAQRTRYRVTPIMHDDSGQPYHATRFALLLDPPEIEIFFALCTGRWSYRVETVVVKDGDTR